MTGSDRVDAVRETYDILPEALRTDYRDFASIIEEVEKVEEQGTAFTSSQIPDHFDVEDVPGMDYGFEASASYEDSEISLKYREKDRGMFSTEELARFNMKIEGVEDGELRYSTFWEL